MDSTRVDNEKKNEDIKRRKKMIRAIQVGITLVAIISTVAFVMRCYLAIVYHNVYVDGIDLLIWTATLALAMYTVDALNQKIS